MNKSTTKHRYISRELIRKEVGKGGKLGVPCPLSDVGCQSANFISMIRLSLWHSTNNPIFRSRNGVAPQSLAQIFLTFLACLLTRNPLDQLGSSPKQLDQNTQQKLNYSEQNLNLTNHTQETTSQLEQQEL